MMKEFQAVVLMGMYEWHDKDINDTVRCLTEAFKDLDRYYIDPPKGLRALKGDLAYVCRSLSWRWSQDGDILVGVPPLGFLPVKLGLREQANRYAACGLIRKLKNKYGPDWRDKVLFYVSSGSYTITGFIDSLSPKHLVFHILDDNFAFPIIKSDRRVWEENKVFIDFMVLQSSLVIAVSQELVRKYSEMYNRKIYVLGNGVDVEHFNPNHQALSVVPELVTVSEPVLMFIGAVNSWIDIVLLNELAENRSHYSLVIIGPCYENSIDLSVWNSLKEKNNVLWLGSKPFAELPSYIQYASVLLLPRTRDEHSLASDPLKLYEYLATGKPVVAVGIPAVQKFTDFVYSADSREDFIEQIDKALSTWDEEKQAIQVAAAKGYSWSSRVRTIFKLLDEVR